MRSVVGSVVLMVAIGTAAAMEQSRSGTERPFIALILFFACLFSGALASQSSFYTLFFAGLQVEGVALDLLDDVFLLHLALEAA